MKAEGDTASAQLAIQQISAACEQPKLTIRIPAARPLQLVTMEEDLIASVEKLQKKNRIFGELPTVDELTDPIQEREVSEDSPYAFPVGLSTGAPAGYPDPDLRVFGVTKPIPGPTRIFSHRSPGSAGQIPVGHGYPQVYLRVTDTCRYTCADGYSNTCGLQVYLRVTNTHRYTCTDGYWRVYLQVSSSEMFIVHASDYIVYH
jgi:hypothetical protein